MLVGSPRVPPPPDDAGRFPPSAGSTVARSNTQRHTPISSVPTCGETLIARDLYVMKEHATAGAAAAVPLSLSVSH